MTEQAHFICPASESTEVYRPANFERPAPTCVSCAGTQSGECEMVWVGDENAY